MTFPEYLALSKETEPNAAQYSDTISRFDGIKEIAHHAIGFSTEVSEFVESKHKPEFEGHAHEEKGDMWWYVAGLVRHCLDNGAALILDHSSDRVVSTDDLVIIAGKLLDQAKRAIFYGSIDMDKVREYTQTAVQMLCDLGDAPSCWAANVEKLNRKRYKNGFSESAALNRDIDAERQAMNGGGAG